MGRTRIAIALLPTLALAGCLERRLHITSTPPGALVTLNDVDVGRTPVEVDFTHYGVYDVRLRREGYEPLVTHAEAKAPVYEWPGIDFFAEVFPSRIVTDIDWHFDLTPARDDVDALVARARQMQDQVGGAPAEAGPPPPEESGQTPPAEPRADKPAAAKPEQPAAPSPKPAPEAPPRR